MRSDYRHLNVFARYGRCLPALGFGLAMVLFLLSSMSCGSSEQTEQQKLDQLVKDAASDSSAGEQAADDLARMASEGNAGAQEALFSHICDSGMGSRLRTAMVKYDVYHPMPINIPAIAGKPRAEVDAILVPMFGAGQPSIIRYSTPGVEAIDYCDEKVRITYIKEEGADSIVIEAGVDGLKFQKESLAYFGLPVVEPIPEVNGRPELERTMLDFFFDPQLGISGASFFNDNYGPDEGFGPSEHYRKTGNMESVVVEVSGKYITMP